MNLPNKLTILRVILTMAFIFLLFSNGLSAKVWALVVFTLAAITDALDGFIAKAQNQITDFGKLVDPIADKLLILSAFLAFVGMQIIPAWMVVIIVFREIAVTAWRAMALGGGRIIPAGGGGKHKMILQVLAVFIILLFVIFKEGGSSVFKFWNADFELSYKNTIFIVMLVAVVFTLASGLSYLLKNKGAYSYEKED